MKRVFAHIGFSFAFSMLILNLTELRYVLPIMAGLTIIFIASLVIKKYRQAIAVPLCIGTAIFACLIFLFSLNAVVWPQQELNMQSADCEFYITDLPQKNEDNSYSYTIKTTKINLDNSPQNIKLRLKTNKPVKCSSHQIIKGKLTFYRIGSNSFSSFGYWGKNIFLSSSVEDYIITNNHIHSPMKIIVEARKGIKNRFSKIGGDEGALSSAMMIGDKSGLSDKLYNDFRFSGASHLMAVSGLHLTAVTGFFILLFKKLRLNEKLSFSLTIAIILYYCALCGFSKSVVRAGIMMVVLMLGKIFNRHSDALNSLGIASFIIFLNPFAVFDIGAVLSILSVLSLCTAFPYFNKKLSFIEPTKIDFLNKAVIYISKGFMLAFCITAYSLPAMFIFFGYVCLAGLISNIILVPLGSLATIIALLTNLALKLNAKTLFILISKSINKIIIYLVSKFAAFRFSVINFENYFGIVIAGILIIFAFCFIINKKFIKPACIISVIIISVSVISMAIINETRTYVYAGSSGAAVVCDGGKAVVFGVNSRNDYYGVKGFLTLRKADIDCLVITDENKYNELLIEKFSCDKIISKEFSEKLLNTEGSEYITAGSYSEKLGNNFEVYWNTKGKAHCLITKINGFSVADGTGFSKTGDIFISNRKCTDSNGTILLTDGAVIYSISNGKYTVRRVDIWQE